MANATIPVQEAPALSEEQIALLIFITKQVHKGLKKSGLAARPRVWIDFEDAGNTLRTSTTLVVIGYGRLADGIEPLLRAISTAIGYLERKDALAARSKLNRESMAKVLEGLSELRSRTPHVPENRAMLSELAAISHAALDFNQRFLGGLDG